MQGFSLDSFRRMAEDKIQAAVDGVLTHIPNGQQYRDQFHQAIGGAINEIQEQAQNQMGNAGGLLGHLKGMFGHNPEQGHPPQH